MNGKRALTWGAVGGLVIGFAMLKLAFAIDNNRNLGPVFWLLHRPVMSLLDRCSSTSGTFAIILGYWTTIGIVAGLLSWLVHVWVVRRR